MSCLLNPGLSLSADRLRQPGAAELPRPAGDGGPKAGVGCRRPELAGFELGLGVLLGSHRATRKTCHNLAHLRVNAKSGLR
jgi:hypothetical protein